MAESGEPTSAHFTSEGALKQPIERINLDLETEMLKELSSL